MERLLDINSNIEFSMIYSNFINDNNQIFIISYIGIKPGFNYLFRTFDLKGNIIKDINIIDIKNSYKIVNYM